MNHTISQVKKGNRHAMDKLYKSTVDELSYYCTQLCGNKHDAEDLVQDTYMTAFQKIEQYKRDENFKGWLHTIALHKFYNKIRDEKPQLFIDEDTDTIAEDELLGPENISEQKELNRILFQAISEKLSESQRLTVMMYYYDDMDISDIAEKLECPQGTVKTRLYHSRKILRDELVRNGIKLGGTAVVISVALKSHALTASAVSSSALATSFISKKIVAGLVAVTVATGGAVGIYKAVSSVKISSGELVEYTFDVNTMHVSIPENYITEKYFRSGNDEYGYSLVKINFMKNESENRNFMGFHVKEILVFRPDDSSGDEIVFRQQTKNPEEIDLKELISETYDDVSLSDSEKIKIKMDNTNSPKSPDERDAEKVSFKARSESGKIKGTALIFKGNFGRTHVIFFCDCSGKREKEFDEIIDSISLSYVDNSWRDRYDIPEEFK